ncbi:MAG: OmpA family protein, partial [Verrucomicrobiota bacterium]
GKPERSVPAVLRAIPAEPQPLLVSLSSLFYTRHSFLLQANQDEKIEEIVKQLSAPPLSGHTLLLRAVKSNAQGNAYGDYLVEKRGNAAKELLTERGIPEARITLDPITLSSRVDTGEVRLVVRIPPTPSESSEDADSAAEVDAPPPDRAIVEGSP